MQKTRKPIPIKVNSFPNKTPTKKNSQKILLKPKKVIEEDEPIIKDCCPIIVNFPQPSSQSPIPQNAVIKPYLGEVIDKKMDIKECKSDTEMIEDDEPTCCTLNQTTQTLIEEEVAEAPQPVVAVEEVKEAALMT